MKLKYFLSVLLLGFCLTLDAESSEKYWLTEQEYNQIIQNMMTAQKELNQSQTELNQLKSQLQTQSDYYKKLKSENRIKNLEVGVICFSAGVLATSIIFAVASNK